MLASRLTVVRDEIGAETILRPSEALREHEGQDLVVWGSLTLVRTLAQAGLVDEYQLWLLPVVLGGGRPLFGEGVGTIALTLLEAKTSDRGSTLLRYAQR